MDKRFLRAFLAPRATRLAGYELYPWCIKHRIQLTALEHPVIVGGEITAGDVISFARICAEKPMLPKMGWGDQWQYLRLTLRRDGLSEAIEAIKAHMLLEHWPKFWEKGQDGSESGGTARNGGVPWALAVVANLTRNGLSIEQAMHLPEAQAIWLSTTFSIHAGAKIDLFTTEDEELLDSLSTVESQTKDEPKPTI
jgi:hypothetical protein